MYDVTLMIFQVKLTSSVTNVRVKINSSKSKNYKFFRNLVDFRDIFIELCSENDEIDENSQILRYFIIFGLDE